MMDLTGKAALALWNGVDPERRAEYDLWHTREHVPERLSIPGIVAARRYRLGSGPLPEYFTLYDVDDAEVLSSPAYRHLLENPSEWSRTMRPSFRGFLRICGHRVSTTGGGTGSAMAAMLMGDSRLAGAAGVQDLLRDCLAEGPFVAGHVITRNHDIPDVPFRIGGDMRDYPTEAIVLLEAYDLAALEAGRDRLEARLRAAGLEDMVATLSFYGLAYALDYNSLGRVQRLDIRDAAKLGGDSPMEAMRP